MSLTWNSDGPLTESVAFFRRSSVGEDDFGEPVMGYEVDTVAGCLVNEPIAGDLPQVDRPDGIRLRCTVAVPKTYAGDLEHARVALVARGMDGSATDDAYEAAYRVSGAPSFVPQSPLPWNRIVEAGYVAG